MNLIDFYFHSHQYLLSFYILSIVITVLFYSKALLAAYACFLLMIMGLSEFIIFISIINTFILFITLHSFVLISCYTLQPAPVCISLLDPSITHLFDQLALSYLSSLPIYFSESPTQSSSVSTFQHVNKATNTISPQF